MLKIYKGDDEVTWLYVILGVVLLGSSLWGWIARYKWTEKQVEKIKDEV